MMGVNKEDIQELTRYKKEMVKKIKNGQCIQMVISKKQR